MGTIQRLADIQVRAEEIGTSSEHLQILEQATLSVGLTTDQASMALRRFSDAVGEDSTAITDLGVRTRNADGSVRDMWDVLLDVADAMSRMESESEQLSAAVDLFGQRGARMVRLLREGKEEIEDWADQAIVIDERFTAMADNMATTWEVQLDRMVRGFDSYVTTVLAGIDAINQRGLAASNARDLGAAGGQLIGQYIGSPALLEQDIAYRRAAETLRHFSLPGLPVPQETQEVLARLATRGAIQDFIGSDAIMTFPNDGLGAPSRNHPTPGAGGGGAGGAATDRSGQRIAELAAQIGAQDRLVQALFEGEDAYRRTEEAIRAEAEALRLGIDLTSEQGRVFLELSGQLAEGRRREEDLIRVRQEADRAAQDYLPSVSALDEAQRALNDAIAAGLDVTGQYAEALESVGKQQEFLTKGNQEALDAQLERMQAQADLQDDITDGAIDWLDALRQGKLTVEDIARSWDDLAWEYIVEPWARSVIDPISNQIASGVNRLGLLGSNSGGLGGLLGQIFGDFNFPGFAGGGSFDVGSRMPMINAGLDNRLVAFAARDGERVTVTPPGRSGPDARSVIVNLNVSTPDADSFRRNSNSVRALVHAGGQEVANRLRIQR